ncbi:uncharacterized protein LOC106051929 [Biomphalaria glabrata]|uniref:Uncharacterized protein LOC106051929 n=1 Tax=Biomphalaria glabrata TaxID=6526 RepID=A0A9U8DW87_BIOGL|nr:uncharacterized protein LOC106051929 [Biomphalaria glabrata]
MYYLSKFIFGESETEKKDSSGEQLETQLLDDWVVVHPSDKENSGRSQYITTGQSQHISGQSPHITFHPNSHHHFHHHSHLPHQGQGLCCHSQVAGDSLGANFVIGDELLDDADSLATTCGHVARLSPLHDCGNIDLLDSDCSSDTESVPESVFSASSGRSHATYHPHGNASEPWVVAPAPCFTGSQVGEKDGLSDSPLENLLIEHPSMSVYLSLRTSHHLPSIRPTGEGFRDIVQEDPVLQPEPDGAAVSVVETRLVNSMLSPGLATPEQMTLRLRSAQRIQNCKSKRSITNRRCEQQNKVYEVQGQSKANNRRNKRLRPSGFKSSRITQRM